MLEGLGRVVPVELLQVRVARTHVVLLDLAEFLASDPQVLSVTF